MLLVFFFEFELLLVLSSLLKFEVVWVTRLNICTVVLDHLVNLCILITKLVSLLLYIFVFDLVGVALIWLSGLLSEKIRLEKLFLVDFNFLIIS